MKASVLSVLFIIFFGMTMSYHIQAQFIKRDQQPEAFIHNLFDLKQQADSRYEYPSQMTPMNQLANYRLAAKKAVTGVVNLKVVFSPARKPTVTDIDPNALRDYDFWRHFFEDNLLPVKPAAAASGVIISPDGYIVTNHHVVQHAETLLVTLHDRRVFAAKQIGSDSITDIALIKIDAQNLPFIQFGCSDSTETGDIVLAAGNPFNLASTVTAGILSAKSRSLDLGTINTYYNSFLQTDAVENGGNSGGALVDLCGRLIGINSAMMSNTGSYAGYSFAIPVEVVKKVVDDLARFGAVQQPSTGIIFHSQKALNAHRQGNDILPDLYIDSLVVDGAAMRAGLKVGDLLIAVDERPVTMLSEVQELFTRKRPGECLALTVLRNGVKKQSIIVLLPLAPSVKTLLSGKLFFSRTGLQMRDISRKEQKKWQVAGGVIVTRILPGSVQRETDMKAGFVITHVNDRPVNNKKELLEISLGEKEHIMLQGIYPGDLCIFYYPVSFDEDLQFPKR